MRLKKCAKCGKLFNTAKNEQTLCDECVATAKSTTIRPRTCRECGTTFDGGPRAWYCPECRKIREKESTKRYRDNGPTRPLGSIDHCIVCGKEYVVKSGLQHYCPDCAGEAVRQLDREASKKWNAENNFYQQRSQKPRSGQKICVICGKPVPPGTPRVTCSEECDKLRIKYNQGKAEIKRGTCKFPTTVERLGKEFPLAPVELTPEIIKELEADLLSVIKRCPDCGQLFVKKSKNARFCRACALRRSLESTQKSSNEHYYADVEASRAKRREDYAKNREAVRAYQAAYYAAHKDEIKQRRQQNQQKKAGDKKALKAYQAKYYAQNKERIKAQRKAKKERDAAEKK